MSATATKQEQAIAEAVLARDIGTQWRCRRCGRLLAIGNIAPGTWIVIRCKCKHENALP